MASWPPPVSNRLAARRPSSQSFVGMSLIVTFIVLVLPFRPFNLGPMMLWPRHRSASIGRQLLRSDDQPLCPARIVRRMARAMMAWGSAASAPIAPMPRAQSARERHADMGLVCCRLIGRPSWSSVNLVLSRRSVPRKHLRERDVLVSGVLVGGRSSLAQYRHETTHR
jgi:hypothetical protein